MGAIQALKFRYWFINEYKLIVRPLIDWALGSVQNKFQEIQLDIKQYMSLL